MRYSFFELIGRGLKLFFKSFKILLRIPKILIFPLISTLFMIFILFLFKKFVLSFTGSTRYVISYLFYLLSSFVIIFFNSAFVYCVYTYLLSGRASLLEGISVAISRLGKITIWSFLTSTLMLILSLVREQLSKKGYGFLGDILGFAGRTTFSLISFFVIPIMVIENRGPFESLKLSGKILKEDFGETITGKIALSFAKKFLLIFTTFLLMTLLFYLNIKNLENGFHIPIMLIVLFALVIAVILILFNAVDSSLATVIYLYFYREMEEKGINVEYVNLIKEDFL